MKRSAIETWWLRLAIAGALPLGACSNRDLGVGDAAVQQKDMAVTDALPSAPDCEPAPARCTSFYFLDGGTPTDGFLPRDADTCASCYLLPSTPPSAGSIWSCAIDPTACGNVLSCNVMCTGRRPSGLALPSVRMSDKIGDDFARMAHLEAASVPAFVRLVAELSSHGASEHLVASARRAILDEERHFAMMSDLATRRGARVPAVEVEAFRERPLVAMAIENAVEGCVRESAGALAAMQQAKSTPDRDLSRILSSIAIDEQRHADLAWAVHGWLARRLTRDEKVRVTTAMREELRALHGGAVLAA